MQLTITKLAPQRRNPDLVDLHINGELRSTVAFEAVNQERLHPGDVITTEQLDRLLTLDERWRARHAALSLLGARARTRGELADRLRRKGFGDAAVQHALAEVDRLGFLDDAAFAESWVRDRLRLRPRGTQALVHELGRKHVPADVARAAVQRVMAAQNATDDDLCLAAAVRWTRARPRKPGEDDLRRERRLAAFLARRGYGPGDIRAAVEAVRERGT